jgi:hypothetical protein
VIFREIYRLNCQLLRFKSVKITDLCGKMHFGLRIAGEKEALKSTSMTIEKLTTKSIEALKNAESIAKLKGHQLLGSLGIFSKQL